jgi:hypothetical protein
MEGMYFIHPDQISQRGCRVPGSHVQRLVVSPAFAFGYQLQAELRSHYVHTARPEEVDAWSTSVRVMAQLLSFERADRSHDVALRLCRAALLDFVDVSMLVDEAVGYGCRLLADTCPKLVQGRWVHRFYAKAGIVLEAFDQALALQPGEAIPGTVQDALDRAGIRDLSMVLRRCTQAHRRVVLLARSDADMAPWRALSAILGPHLTESAIADLGIKTGRASQTPPHAPAHIYYTQQHTEILCTYCFAHSHSCRGIFVGFLDRVFGVQGLGFRVLGFRV